MKEKEVCLNIDKGEFENIYEFTYKEVSFFIKNPLTGKPEYDLEIPSLSCSAKENRFLTLNRAVKKAKEIIDLAEKQDKQNKLINSVLINIGKEKGEHKQQLLKVFEDMSDEELALMVATGLDCEKCPVTPTCYNKVVCNKNIFNYLVKNN